MPFHGAYTSYPFSQEGQRRLTDAVNGLMDGKSNNTGFVILSPNTTSTTVKEYRCGVDSVILFMPLTPNAAVAAGTIYTATAKEQFTINHANTATTDRRFKYAIIG